MAVQRGYAVRELIDGNAPYCAIDILCGAYGKVAARWMMPDNENLENVVQK
jgi:hypothetical protein